ncbi:MAG TPA: GNAT family protein [Polyangiaceae bacterium]|nr:GNAT family protein [Polyangiaceae bacterium]
MARVVIRAATSEDEAPFVRLLEASATHLGPWMPQTPWSNVELFQRFLATGRTDVHHKSLLVRVADGELLGTVNLNEIIRGAFQNAILGYWLGAAYVGHGYMREGVALALAQAFEGLALHRVEANVMPRNQHSRRVLLSLGFRLEGHSPEYLQIAGRWEGHDRFALVDREWRAARTSIERDES